MRCHRSFQNRTAENADVCKSPSIDGLDMGLSVQSLGNHPKESQRKVQQDFARVENVHGKVFMLETHLQSFSWFTFLLSQMYACSFFFLAMFFFRKTEYYVSVSFVYLPFCSKVPCDAFFECQTRFFFYLLLCVFVVVPLFC